MRRPLVQRLLALGVLLLTASGCLGPSGALPGAAPLESVPELDLERYAGTWYELARYPVSFEDGLVAVTAEYTLNEDGTVHVLNQGRRERLDGPVERAEAKAWVPDPEHPARLAVRFFWPFRSAYWVIELEPDYRWALVGEPKRRVLWVLARAPRLDAETWDWIREAITAHGYDLQRLELTPQLPDAGPEG